MLEREGVIATSRMLTAEHELGMQVEAGVEVPIETNLALQPDENSVRVCNGWDEQKRDAQVERSATMEAS